MKTVKSFTLWGMMKEEHVYMKTKAKIEQCDGNNNRGKGGDEPCWHTRVIVVWSGRMCKFIMGTLIKNDKKG